MVEPKPHSESLMLAPSLYESDFYAWTLEQAALLRDQQWTQVDLSNLIEEIEKPSVKKL
jgi:Domain of unknown function DUF29